MVLSENGIIYCILSNWHYKQNTVVVVVVVVVVEDVLVVDVDVLVEVVEVLVDVVDVLVEVVGVVVIAVEVLEDVVEVDVLAAVFGASRVTFSSRYNSLLSFTALVERVSGKIFFNGVENFLVALVDVASIIISLVKIIGVVRLGDVDNNFEIGVCYNMIYFV